MKFKSNIELQAGLEDNNAASGTAGQVLSATGNGGGVEWIDQATLTDTQANLVYFNVKNSSGATINKGKGVMAVGSDGNSGHILIDEMVADGSVESKYFLGVLETTVDNGGLARVISFGELDQFNTLGQNGETWNDGDILWCDPNSAGDFTITEPDGPNLKIPAAIVLNSATNGKIQVRVQANEGIHDLYDTKIVNQVDGDILVWDNTTGVWFNDSTLNVDQGVGVDITGNLDVSGDVTAQGDTVTLLNENSGNKNINIRKRFDGSSYINWIRSSNTDAYIGVDETENLQIGYASSGLNRDLIFTSNNSEVIRFDRQGNVGIGTTDPTDKLQIDATNSQLRLRDTDDGTYTQFSSSGNKFAIRQNSTSANHIWLTSSGNVGIGTESPGYTLDVNGTLHSSNITLADGIYHEGDTNTYINFLSDQIQMATAGSVRAYINSLGNVGIGMTSPGAKLHIATSSGQEGIIINNSNGTQTFHLGHLNSNDSYFRMTNNANVVEVLFRTDGLGSYINTGNVGIGTTSPSEKLDVVGNIELSGNVIDASSAAYYLDLNGTSQLNHGYFFSSLSFGGFSAGTRGTQLEGYSTHSVVRTDSDRLDFYMGKSPGGVGTMMSLTKEGKVGIGTTSPSQKLEIAGAVKVTSNFSGETSANSGYFDFYDGTTRITSKGADGSTLGSFSVLQQASDGSPASTSFHISSSGNVGIGTTSPSEKLDVVGNINVSGTGTFGDIVTINRPTGNNGLILATTGTNAPFVKWENSTSAYRVRMNDSDRLSFLNGSDVETVFIDQSGNVEFDGTGTFGGNLDISNNNILIDNNKGFTNSGSWTRNQTPYGYIEFGPANSSWAHIYTDRNNFYFNRNLYVNGNLVWNAGNDGSGSGLDADTLDGQHASAFVNVTGDTMTGDLTVGNGTADNYVRSYHSDGSYTEMRGYGLQFNRGSSYIRPTTDNTKILFLGSNTLQWLTLSIDASTTTFNTNGSENMRITSAGNVGIGTTSPTRKLDVQVNTANDDGIVIRDENGNIRTDFTLAGTAGVREGRIKLIDNSGNANVQIHSDTVSYFNGGNVGIGTTSPDHKLHIVGNSAIAAIDGSDTNGKPMLFIGEQNAYGIGFRWDSSLSLDIIDFDNTTISTTGGTKIGHFKIRDEEFYWKGNVGIGTTSPNTKLEVSAATDTTISIASSDTTLVAGQNIGILEFASNNESSLAQAYTAFSKIKGISEFTVSGTGSVSGAITFETANANVLSEKMRITGTGLVGIGTDSPVNKLDVHNSGSGIRHYGDSSNQLETFCYGSNQVFIATNGSVTNEFGYTGGNFYVQTNDQEKLRITSSGNVGIGTTSPGAKLDVNGHVNASNGYSTNNTSRKYFWRTDNTVSSGTIWKKIGTYNSSGQSSRIMITITGTVSYSGGTKPGKTTILAQVNNNNLLEGTFWTEGMSSQYGNVGFISNSNTSHDIYYQVGSYGEYAYEAIISDGSFTPDSTTVSTPTFTRTATREWNVNQNLIVNSSGNVGIGTTSPSSKFHVAQTISSTINPGVYFEADSGPSVYGGTNVRVDNIDYGGGMSFYRAGTFDSKAIAFINGTTQVGSISINTSSTSYNTTSDYRLKENLTEITDGIERLKQLQPKRFNFIGDTNTVDGFIAHEAKQVVPEAVTGEKDGVLPNGDPIYQGIDQAKLVPLLTAALQEAITKIEQLETRIQTLENK